ncbi:hypothetical protein ACFXEF_16590 [Brevibacterium sediminis]
MDNNDEFFRVARLSRELREIDSELAEAARRRAEREAIANLDPHLPLVQDDVASVVGQWETCVAREAEFLESREDVVERLLPAFLNLAALEFGRLDEEFGSKEWGDTAERCLDAIETLAQAYTHRLQQAINQWNHVAEALLDMSHGLPGDDAEREMEPSSTDASGSPSDSAGSAIRRIGPTASGGYTGIEVNGQAIEMVSHHETIDEFLTALESGMKGMLAEARKSLLSGSDCSTEVVLDPSPSHLIWRQM